MAKILVVDDAVTIRQLLRFTLQQAGHQVDEAEDGASGLQQALAASYDLVITDRNMPNMNGIEFARALRSEPAYKFTPILVLTTEADASKKQEGKAAGVTGWIVKPFNPNSLLAVLQKVLS